MRTSVHIVARSALAAGSALAVAAGLLSASPAALAASTPVAAAVAPAATATLKRLPAGHDELVFRGENAARAWQVYLSPTEAARISSFQLGLLNSVVDLPDRSSVKLTINGRPLAAAPVRSPDEITNVAVKIPPGVLLPGANTVQVNVALAHRVDCSVGATYELWALLDPARTGFVVDNADSYVIRSLDELAAEPLAEDGATHIHVRTQDFADPISLGRAARFVDALVRRAGLARPIVDVGPEAGQGPGFDVVLFSGDAPDAGSGGSLRVLGRDDDITLARDAATNRLALILSGTDEADLDARIAALDKARPRLSLGRASPQGVAIDAGGRKSFAELGLATDGFSGRHFQSSVDIALPADFYPSGYEKARLLIDGYHSGALDGRGELIVRVNDAIVSSISMASGMAEKFDRQPVELPLRFFHPGHNEISIEGITSSALDQQCDLVSMPRDARLTIAGTSELEFPSFAHLGTLPQIPSALATIAAPEKDGHPTVYLADLDRNSAATALTILANMASTSGKFDAPIVRLERPTPGDVPGIVVGSLDQLPDYLATPLQEIAAPADPTVVPAETAVAADGSTQADAAAADAPKSQEQPAAAAGVSFKDRLRDNFASGALLSKTADFLFPVGDRRAGLPTLPAHFLLIGAVNPNLTTKTIGGVTVPQLAHDASQWLVVSAQNSDGVKKGVERLIVDGQWRDLAGQAVSLDLDSGSLRSAQPAHVAYVEPSAFVLSDVRPILGGILSDNILLTFGALIALVSILGLSTHALIRKSGVR
jgi:hypothetical protein